MVVNFTLCSDELCTFPPDHDQAAQGWETKNTVSEVLYHVLIEWHP
jgi:hypothetical protein